MHFLQILLHVIQITPDVFVGFQVVVVQLYYSLVAIYELITGIPIAGFSLLILSVLFECATDHLHRVSEKIVVKLNIRFTCLQDAFNDEKSFIQIVI